MATLTRSRARLPLAEASPTYSYNVSGAGPRFTIYLEAERTPSDVARYYRLELTKDEVKHLGKRLAEFFVYIEKESVEVFS